MIVILDALTTPAPPEEVWKLLYDPSRFPSWWEGLDAVEPGGADRLVFRTRADGAMPQRLRTDRTAGRVTVSCLVLDVEFQWSLSTHVGGTRIAVRCALPDREAARAPAQRAALGASLRRLAEIATTDAPPV